MRKTAFLILLFLVISALLASVLSSQSSAFGDKQYSRLAPQESEIIARVNGTNAYNYDLELERIALNRSMPNYAFRSAGSAGASEAAQWIKSQFESFGLEATMERFEFTCWNLPSQPALVIDEDGNTSTTSDQMIIRSFQSEHYSWPTPEGGVFKDLVILPLPEAPTHNAFGRGLIDSIAWNGINTTGKILLIGREIRWSGYYQQVYVNKLRSQPPAAVVYTYWYEWMSSAPQSFSSAGGLPLSYSGPYYWDLNIPVGYVSYGNGLWIRNREYSLNVSASLTIPAVIQPGVHYNVVGRLKGSVNTEKTIIISSHYDTVMTSGFCDNGAGTAGVVELARVFANAAKEGLYKPEETLLFISFTGEELGLVGSINYVRQHKDEMKDITAVVNLDCIGSSNFNFTETFPNDDGLDLDEIVLKTAEDLGIKATMEGTADSDHETFRNPMMADTYYQFWGLHSGISNVTRVKASIMLDSYPLFFSDKWQSGVPGWIHTQYDNSTSTQTLKWVEVDDLEAHIQVAALSVMRVLSYDYGLPLWQIVTFTVVTGIIIAGAVFFQRSRVNITLKKAYNNILYYIGMKELIGIFLLTALFLFISYIVHMRIGRIEVLVSSFPTPVTMAYFGYPFEMVGIEQMSRLPPTGESEGALAMEWTQSYVVGVQILWEGLFLNLVLYFLLAFGLMYTSGRLKGIYTDKR